MKNDSVPAAHSMDTAWFAVDAEGRVGLFETGEDGALPTRAANLGGAGDPTFDTLVFEAALVAKTHEGTWAARETPPPDEPERLLVVKQPPALDPQLFEEISAGPPWVGLSREPLRYSKLEGRDEFVTVLTESEINEELDHARRMPSVFHFHRNHGEEPGHYDGVEDPPPPKPLLIDSLPTSAREAIGALRLPIDFTTAKTVHLADHLKDDEAEYWGEWTLRGFGDLNRPPPQPLAPEKPAWPWVIVLALVLAALFLWRVL